MPKDISEYYVWVPLRCAVVGTTAHVQLNTTTCCALTNMLLLRHHSTLSPSGVEQKKAAHVDFDCWDPNVDCTYCFAFVVAVAVAFVVHVVVRLVLLNLAIYLSLYHRCRAVRAAVAVLHMGLLGIGMPGCPKTLHAVHVPLNPFPNLGQLDAECPINPHPLQLNRKGCVKFVFEYAPFPIPFD